MSITTFLQNNPRLGLFILSFFVTLFITIVNSFMMDKEKMKDIKEKQKRLKEEMKKYKDNPQKKMEINRQMMEDMPEQMKQSFKPLIITFIPLIILFNYLRTTFAITPLKEVSFIFPNWIWYYMLFSMIFSIVLRKMFKLQ